MYFLNCGILCISNTNFNSTSFYFIFNKEKCDNSTDTSKYLLYSNLVSLFSVFTSLV